MKPDDPTTDAEWQDTCEWAEVLLALDAARHYGLIVGGPPVNTARCRDVLDRAARRGITPRPDSCDRLIGILQAALTRGRL